MVGGFTRRGPLAMTRFKITAPLLVKLEALQGLPSVVSQNYLE